MLVVFEDVLDEIDELDERDEETEPMDDGKKAFGEGDCDDDDDDSSVVELFMVATTLPIINSGLVFVVSAEIAAGLWLFDEAAVVVPVLVDIRVELDDTLRIRSVFVIESSSLSVFSFDLRPVDGATEVTLAAS